MSRVRYIAILSEDPKKLASFYGSAFGLSQLSSSSNGDATLSDGFLKLAIFKIRGDLGEARMEPGLHRIGIEVDNFERVKARFRRRNLRGVMVPEVPGEQYGELRFYDPESIPVSLSQRSFGLKPQAAETYLLGHVGFDVLDPAAMADFYQDVFGFQRGPSEGGGDRPSQTLDDGTVNLAFHNFFAPRAGHDPRYGVSRLGLLVEDVAKVAAQIPGATLSAENDEVYDARDPDGNRLQIRQARAGASALDRWRRVA